MTIKHRPKRGKPETNQEPVGIKLLKVGAVIVAGLILLTLLIALWFFPVYTETHYNTPYEDCVAAGNPILKTYPAKCIWPSGQTVTQIIPGVNDIDSFEDCAAAGYPIMESYPEQCRTPDGKTFVRNITAT